MRRPLITVSLLCAFAVPASHASSLDPRAEASLLVEGKATLNPDGSVASYTLREPDKLPTAIVELVNQSLPHWRFRFGDGRTPDGLVEENMHLRIVAHDVDDRHTTIRIASAQFEDATQGANDRLASKDRKMPVFPSRSLQGRMSGTVYVLVRVNKDGTVSDAAAEQVNLRHDAERDKLKIYRDDLAQAAVHAIKQWTFTVPTEGPSARQSFWYATVPVHFNIGNSGYDEYNGHTYGTWEIYLRGPQETIPWFTDDKALADGTDATPDGSVHQLGSGAQLLTALAPD